MSEHQVEAGTHRSQRFWSAATRQLRLGISSAMMAAESASRSPRTREQTTAFNSPSVSMVAPTILCRGSECRGAPVGTGLGVPRFPRGPPGTCGSREDPHVVAVRLDPEHLMTPGHPAAQVGTRNLAG